MECIADDVDGGHLRIRYLDALLISRVIQFTTHRQPLVGGSGSDQIDDYTNPGMIGLI